MEFFRHVRADTHPETLRAALTTPALPDWCGSVFAVEEGATADAGVVGCIWGRFTFHREAVNGGVRFTLPECPNALAVTITTHLPPDPGAVVIHGTINRQEADPDFVESVETFVDDWAAGLQAGLSFAHQDV